MGYFKNIIFNTNLSILSAADKLLIGAMFFILALSVVFYFLKRTYSKHLILFRFFRRVFIGCLSVGIIGIFWAVLRYLAVPFLGYRLVAFLILCGFFIWLFFILKYLILEFPSQKQNWDTNRIKSHYLNLK